MKQALPTAAMVTNNGVAEFGTIAVHSRSNNHGVEFGDTRAPKIRATAPNTRSMTTVNY
ncbi:MAG: hypothetical protein ACRDRA_18285 [Pseudonocardiaceae bacterium]